MGLISNSNFNYNAMVIQKNVLSRIRGRHCQGPGGVNDFVMTILKPMCHDDIRGFKICLKLRDVINGRSGTSQL